MLSVVNNVAGPLDMDSLNYKYNRDINGNIINNRLNHVRDQVSSANYSVDIDNQNTGNYTYDRIGNLKTDAAEGINNINWTVYGKIKDITKTAANTTIQYSYDPGGNRTTKKVTISGGATNEETTTWYIRDAQGNVMAIYSKKNTAAVKWNEQHLYGSSRLGMWNWDTIVPAAPPVVQGSTPLYDSLLCGSRTYELSNHLGNVLVTISDKKIGHNNNGVVDYYETETLTANDYYPFGMAMPGRSYSAVSGYRYGFNGQEKSTEVNESSYTAEFWQYDSRIGRRWNVDPMPTVGISVYSTFFNNPILMSDIMGDTSIVNPPSGNNYDNYDKSRTDGYQSKKGIGDGMNLVVDNKGDRYITYEKTELKAYHNDLKSWQATLYYWSERPQKEGEAYAEGAHWVEYKDDLGERAQGMIDLVNKTGTFIAKFAIYAPTFFAGGGSIGLATRGWYWRAGIEAGGQMVASGGDIRKLDVADILFSSTLTPGGNAALGGAIDYRPFAPINKLSVVGFNKDINTSLADFGFKYAFGGNGLQGSVTNSIIRNSGSQAYSKAQQTIITIITQTNISVPGKALRAAFKENLGF